MTMNMKPPAPANRADLKTWTPAQLEFVAPHWIKRLTAECEADEAILDLAKLYQPGTKEHTKAVAYAMKEAKKTQEQLTYWKLIADGVKTYRVLPQSLRTFNRSLGNPVGAWDKTLNLWG
jgi:hypothetical protein